MTGPDLTRRHRLRVLATRLYRTVALRRTTIVAVTGSGGKTMAKTLIAAILGTSSRPIRSPLNLNRLWHVSAVLLKARPWHDACVIEVAAGESAEHFRTTARMARPDVAVVTTVGTDHFTLFRSIEAIAETKSELVKAVRPDGLVVLNADDPRVAAMAALSPGRVLTVGLSPRADVRAEEVRSEWPERLRFTAVVGPRRVPVETQLCGAHWVPSALAALAVGTAMGVPLETAARAVSTVRPLPSRMCPVDAGNGVWFIRDDCKAPFWAIPATLEFLADARARRKVLVLGTISDYPGNPGRKYQAVAREALNVVDAFVGVGPSSSFFLRARNHAAGRPLVAFPTADEARAFLEGFARPGDLILLKGSPRTDALDRIVRDWRPESRRPAERCSPVAADGSAPGGLDAIVGLGNPNRDLAETPHNVGQRVLDLIADIHGAIWTEEGGSAVARTMIRGRDVLLVKPGVPVNLTGDCLRRLAAAERLRPEDFVLVHDDVNLAPGVVRRKLDGSAGGHRGVQSVIVAFQSEKFRRVKVGVGRPDPGEPLPSYVLRPFDADKRECIAGACRQSAEAVMEMVVPARRHREVTAP